MFYILFNRPEEISVRVKDVEGQYLKLPELGEVLHQLSDMCPGMFISTILYIHVIYGCYFLATIQTNRTFLSLKAGQPNLLVVPPEQVLKASLSLYMVDKDLPMPTLEEMLICNHQTTSEEVYY